MRKILVVSLILAVVSAGAYFLFFKKSPPPAPSQSTPKKPGKSQSSNQDDGFRSQDSWSFPSTPNSPKANSPQKDDRPSASDDYWKNSYVRDELSQDADYLQDYWKDYSYYGTPDEQYEFQRMQEQWEEEQLWWEYEMMMRQMQEDELARLGSIYSDPDVQNFRQADLELRKEEKNGKSADQSDWKNLPKDRKDTLKKMADNPNDKSELARLNQATKPMSDSQVKKVQKSLSDPVVIKAKENKKKLMEKKVEKIKEVVKQPKINSSLLQVRKGERKIWIYVIKQNKSFEESVHETLRAKALKAEVLIEQGADDKLVGLYESKKHEMIRLSDSVNAFEEALQKHASGTILIAVREGRLYAGKGVLSLFNSSDYTITYYDDKTLAPIELKEKRKRR